MKMKVDAELFLNEKITKAVITIPANFNDIQRQATKDAGKIAGLDVVRLLPEPIAAVMSYGLHQLSEPSKVLVFDMGAGTLDVSVIEIDDGFFEVISTAGSSKVGGVDMDYILVKYLSEEIEKQYNEKPTDEQSLTVINMIANKIKIKLSDKDEIFFNEQINDEFKISGKINRLLFEEMIENLLIECKNVIMSALKGAGLNSTDINKIVMVGGASKVPAIRKMLSEVLLEPESRDRSLFCSISRRGN